MLEAAYLVFQTEVGVGSTVLQMPYNELGCLATHGFFRNLWQLLSRYGVTLSLPQSTSIPLLREYDRPLMEAVTSAGLFTTKELVQINRVRHWKKVYSIGDLVSCDGLMIKPSVTTPREGKSNREFPLQQPTREAYQSWKKAIGAITISGTKLRNPLGAHISNPHQKAHWFMDQDQSNLYRKLPGGNYEVYERPRTGRPTRFGSTYILSDAVIQEVIPTHHISIRAWNGSTLRFHSSCPI